MGFFAEALKAYLKDDVKAEEFEQGLTALFSKWLETEDGKGFLLSDDTKKLYQAEIDRAVSKAIETYKEKTLPLKVQEAVEEKLKELNPEETPEQKRIRELEERQKQLERETQRAKIKALVLQQLNEKKLSAFADVADLFIRDTEEETLATLATIENAIKPVIENAIKEKLPSYSGNGGNGSGGGAPFDIPADYKNPYNKIDGWNITEQMRLETEEPEKAAYLKQLAEKS